MSLWVRCRWQRVPRVAFSRSRIDVWIYFRRLGFGYLVIYNIRIKIRTSPLMDSMGVVASFWTKWWCKVVPRRKPSVVHGVINGLSGVISPYGWSYWAHTGGKLVLPHLRRRTHGARFCPLVFFFRSHKRAKNHSEVTIFIKSWLQAVSPSQNMAWW